jgi:hypothetical protein
MAMQPTSGLRDEGEEVAMKYEAPKVVDYGSIADHTFTTPGGAKGCQTNCHVDSFNELSALSPA